MRSLALILVSTSFLGCVVALGPGFSHSYRSVDVSATSLEPTRIHVQVTDKLENVGNRDLLYLDVTFPEGPSFGTKDVSVTVEGKVVPSRTVSRQSGSSLRIPFDPRWLQGQERQIAFAYDLDPRPEGRGVVAATADDFYLADPNVFPVWQAPLGPFAQASLRASTQQLKVTVPADFQVLAAGRELRSERQGDSVVHRFEMLGAEFPPYLVAGRYQERRVESERGRVIFWTRESLDDKTARLAAERLAGTYASYEQLFGAVARNPTPIHVVETSAELAPTVVAAQNISAASFPEGVLFDRQAVTLGLAAVPVLERADYELARTWFGWHVRPKAGAEFLLARGMALFATLHAAEARGDAGARLQEITELITTYDSLSRPTEEEPGFGAVTGSSRAELTAKSYKGALFLLSLEDIAGEEEFHRAVRRILANMAGKEIGIDELRSAVEFEAQRNLASEFHAWLDHPGLPAEFRTRHMAAR
jgi:hypothetical protein